MYHRLSCCSLFVFPRPFEVSGFPRTCPSIRVLVCPSPRIPLRSRNFLFVPPVEQTNAPLDHGPGRGLPVEVRRRSPSVCRGRQRLRHDWSVWAASIQASVSGRLGCLKICFSTVPYELRTSVRASWPPKKHALDGSFIYLFIRQEHQTFACHGHPI